MEDKQLFKRFSMVMVLFSIFLIVSGSAFSKDSGFKKISKGKDSEGIIEENVYALNKESRYREYTKPTFDSSKGMHRVYFFHANWCPACKVSDRDLTSNVDKIPENVVVFKTDYDKERVLKKRYNITYQHTFVLVDENGNELTKWIGGGVNELIDNIKNIIK